MSKDLVIGLDSSTSATKAIAWNRDGAPIAQTRASIPLFSPAPDWYEQDPADWWSSACLALRDLLQQVSPDRIAAIAISNQRETFVALDSNGAPVRPAIVWLDQRCFGEVPWLSGLVGPKRIHEISGKPVDTAPVAYRLAWMLRNEPAVLARTATIADVHAYLAWRLTGAFRTSWASADPLGLFDLRAKLWSPEILAALRLDPSQLPHAAAPGSVLGHIHEDAARATMLPAGTPVVAGGGDGQAAGLGVNALSPSRVYLNLGTAVVAGVYSTNYLTGNAWRTMGACSPDGYYLETSLRSGTFLIDWFLANCAPGGAVSRRMLENEAAAIPPGSGGVLALPYWGAVMTPHWDPNARGCFIGLTGAHGPAHLYRALLEGIALEQTLVTRMIEESAQVDVAEFIAIGGGASSDLWCRIIADVSGIPVRRSETVEASSLGAAMCAAAAVGWYPSIPASSEAMAGAITRTARPDPAVNGRYTELLSIYREIYPQLRGTFGKLVLFSQSR